MPYPSPTTFPSGGVWPGLAGFVLPPEPFVPVSSGDEIVDSRRAWPQFERLLKRSPLYMAGVATVGWHGTSANPEQVALVRSGGPRMALVGEVVRLSAAGRYVFVYVYGSEDVSAEISLPRRAFLRLAPLGRQRLRVNVEVVGNVAAR